MTRGVKAPAPPAWRRVFPGNLRGGWHAGCLVALLAGAPVAAQDTTRARLDSLAERLERAEDQLRVLREQFAAEVGSQVRTRSRIALELSGRVLVNGFHNERRVNNVDVPVFVRPDTAVGMPVAGLGGAARQTTLAAALTVAEVLGGTFTGDLDVDFYGGQPASSGGRHFPVLRLRTARAAIAWTHGEVLLGQESPLVAPWNPTSLATIGVPGFTAAGNLWIWLPQARAGLTTAGRVRVGVQGAVLAPLSGDPVGLFDTDVDVAERSERPFVQGRARLAWGHGDLAGELGAGVHRGWFADAPGAAGRVSKAVTADARIPLTSWLEVRGEWHAGQGLRPLGGGAVGQLFAPTGAPVRSTAAWGQVNVRPAHAVGFGGGLGVDDPDDADLGPAGRLRNRQTQAYLTLRPAGPLVLGVEWRRLETTYRTARFANDHLNIALGFEF